MSPTTYPQSFLDALTTTLTFEGGYSNNPADPGGETYCGISRRYWPAWPGWDLIPADGDMSAELALQLQAPVREFYWHQFWLPLKLGEFGYPALAACVFDAAVNLGPGEAVRLLQGILGVAVDGVLGPVTLAAAQKAQGAPHLVTLFCCRRAIHYGELCREDAAKLVFLDGWLRRALYPLAGA